MNTLPSGQNKTSHSLKKPVLWLFVAGVALAIAGGYYWWDKAHAQPRYVTAEVTQGDVERSVNVTGSINPRTTVQVGSYVSGTVKTLSCDFNTQVKAGQVCATIDPSTFQVAVDQAAAQLNSSKAQLHKDEAALVYARTVFERDTKLLKDGVVAQEVADNDRNVYKQAQSQIDLDKATIVAAEANLKSAQVNLGYTKIISPVTGTVLTRNVDVGQTVASSLQTPTLFLIGKDMTKMQVDANVSEADVGRIKVGQSVSFSVQAYQDKPFEGNVKQIRRGPITVQNVVTYDVVVAVDNPELLLFPGMTADAEIVTDSRENVVRVPLAATRFTPEGMRSGDPAHGAADVSGNHASAAGRATKREGDRNAADASAGAAAAANASTSPAAGAAASTAAASAAPQATPAQDRAAHAAEQSNRRDGDGHARWRERGDSDSGSDADRAEHRRAWMQAHPGAHPGEHRGERLGADADHGGGENGQRFRHRGEQDASVDTGKQESKPAADKSGPTTKKTPADASESADANAESAIASSAPAAPAPRKRARVWVLRDGAPHLVALTVGLDDGDMVEVLEGDLKPGDKVIVNEIRPVEATRSAPIQSPFNQGGQRGGAMRRP